MIEREVRRPCGGADDRVRFRWVEDAVGETWGVANRDHVELVARVRRETFADGLVGVFDPRDVSRARDVGVVVAPLEHECGFVAARDSIRPAHDLCPGICPALPVAFDRMPRLRTAVGTIHDAQEVRRRRDQSELDGAVVERADADRVGVSLRPR